MNIASVGPAWCTSWLRKMLWRIGGLWWAPQTLTKLRLHPQTLWGPALPPTSSITQSTAPQMSSMQRRRSIWSLVTSAQTQSLMVMGNLTEQLQVTLWCVFQLFPSVTPSGSTNITVLFSVTSHSCWKQFFLQLLYLQLKYCKHTCFSERANPGKGRISNSRLFWLTPTPWRYEISMNDLIMIQWNQSFKVHI